MAFELKIFHINVLGRRYDYKKTWTKRRPKIVARIKKLSPDVVSAVECGLTEAKELASATGYNYLNYLGSTLLYKKGLKARVLKKYSWLKNNSHSALVVEVTKGKEAVNIAISHLPPFATRAKLRKSQQKKLCQLFNGWSDASIICTDANWSKTFESYVKTLNWVSSRTTATKKFMANYRTSSALQATLFKPGNPIDYVVGKNGKKSPVKFLLYETADGRGLSDHNGLLIIARCGKVVTDTR